MGDKRSRDNIGSAGLINADNESDDDDDDDIVEGRRAASCFVARQCPFTGVLDLRAQRDNPVPSASNSDVVNPIPSTSRATQNSLTPTSRAEGLRAGLSRHLDARRSIFSCCQVSEDLSAPQSAAASRLLSLRMVAGRQNPSNNETGCNLRHNEFRRAAGSLVHEGVRRRREILWIQNVPKAQNNANKEAEISFLSPFMRGSTTFQVSDTENGTASPVSKQNSSEINNSAEPSTSKSAESNQSSSSSVVDNRVSPSSKSSASVSSASQPGVENECVASDSVGNRVSSTDSNDDTPKKRKDKRKHSEEFGQHKYPSLPKEDRVRKSPKLCSCDMSPIDLSPTGNFSGNIHTPQPIVHKHTCERKQNNLVQHYSEEEARVQKARHAVLNHPDYMERIFKWLKLTEQNSFRLVCKSWYEMAHGFWWKSSYNCDNEFKKPEDLEKILTYIEEHPLLKKIVCSFKRYYYYFKVVDTVLKHVDDVHHLEIRYVTPIVVADIVKKYLNLKGFIFDRGSLNILECMDLIKDCSDLERLEFTSDFDHMNNEQHYASICETIVDNFPKLQHLALVPVKNAETVKNVTSLLSEKFENLLSLKLECYESDETMYSLVNMCTKLTELDLKLHSPTISFELCNLSQLTDLKLVFDGNYSEDNVSHTFTSFMMAKPQLLEHLRFELLNDKFDLGVFECICKNFKSLKTLYLWNVDPNILDGQLKSIGALKKLTNLTVFGARITEAGSEYIKMCDSLESLTLMKCELLYPALNVLALSSSLEVIQISFTRLTMKEILEFIALTGNLRKINFTACNIIPIHKRQIYHLLDKDIETRGYVLILG